MADPRIVLVCFGSLLFAIACREASMRPCAVDAAGEVLPPGCGETSLVQERHAASEGDRHVLRRLSASWPQPGLKDHSAKDTVTRWASIVFLFLLKVFIAGSVDVADLPARCSRRTGIVLGVACQFIILPFCGFCTAKMLQLERVQGLSLMVMMTSPGGSFSNWWCSLFNADLAMSVVMTIASALIGVVMLPLNVSSYSTLLYGRGHSLTGEQFVSVLQCFAVIITAMLSGLLASQRWRSEAQRTAFNRAANLVGLALFALGVMVSKDAQNPFWRQPLYIHAATALPILAAMAASTALTGLEFFNLTKPERVSIIIEACYQNPGLALPIVIAMFDATDRAEAVAVPILYGVYEAIFIGVFCLVVHYLNWTLADPDEVSLLQALHGNYQWRAARIIAAREGGVQERDSSMPSTFNSFCTSPEASSSG